MSAMSRDNSTTSLMGFSVHQPALGAPLQFFPAMGSKQLDDMIDAYVPGNASILDKRTTVSMEFFEHAIVTGDLFKFFMVYPTHSSANPSPTMDSGYFSNFSTSPAMSEGQWANPDSQMTSPSSSSSPKKAAAANDFSSLPGMKIMTKDGRDVTNSASRGCKTKEQRDHAHLMRIIKACDACRRKKTKCDPSHKRSPAGTSSGKVAKRTSRNTRAAAAPPPPIAARQASATPEFDQIMSASSSSFDSLFADALIPDVDCFPMEWDQFIQYDPEPSEMIPYDYGFAIDSFDYLSPATASFSSSSASPSQLPITPVDRDVNITDDAAISNGHKPTLPYLNPGGVEAGSNYVDFNLYSPQSLSLDEELGFATEVAASPIKPQQCGRDRCRRTGARRNSDSGTADFQLGDRAVDSQLSDSYRRGATAGGFGDYLVHDPSNYMDQWLESAVVSHAGSQDGVPRSRHAANRTPASAPMFDDVFLGVTSEGLYGRETIENHAPCRTQHTRATRPDNNGLQSLLGPIAAADPTAGVLERQTVLQQQQDGEAYTRKGVGATTTAPSLPPQLQTIRSSGQDDENSANHEGGATVLSDNARANIGRIQTAAIVARGIKQRVSSGRPTPRPTTPSSPVIAISPPMATGLRQSRAAIHTEIIVASAPPFVATTGSLIEQDRSLSVLCDLTSKRRRSSESSEHLSTVPGRSAVSGTPPTLSGVADMSVRLATLSVVSLIVNLTGQSLFNDNIMRHTGLLISWFTISALLLVCRLVQLRGYASSLGTKAKSLMPSFSSRAISFAKQRPNHLIEYIDASSTQFLHLVRCNLSTKLGLWERPQMPFTAGSSRRQSLRRITKQTATPPA